MDFLKNKKSPILLKEEKPNSMLSKKAKKCEAT